MVEEKIIGTLSIDNETADDDDSQPRQTEPEGKTKFKQCIPRQTKTFSFRRSRRRRRQDDVLTTLRMPRRFARKNLTSGRRSASSHFVVDA